MSMIFGAATPWAVFKNEDGQWVVLDRRGDRRMHWWFDSWDEAIQWLCSHEAT
jgi:hypothetical protein